MQNNRKIYSQAFSLIELLTAIIIIAIILLAAFPAWNGIIGKNHALAYANELMTALRFTRATAIKLGEPVEFCPRDGLWQNGAVVTTVKSGKIMRVLAPIFTGDKLNWNGGSCITFLPEGFSRGQQGSFYYCPRNSSEYAVAVILSPSGRTRISNMTYDGKIISCK